MSQQIIKLVGFVKVEDGLHVNHSKRIVNEFQTYGLNSEFLFEHRDKSINAKSILGLVSSVIEESDKLIVHAIINEEDVQRLVLFLEDFLTKITFEIKPLGGE
jgi:phosphotransferase system HPr-like phosphotransfer protein